MENNNPELYNSFIMSVGFNDPGEELLPHENQGGNLNQDERRRVNLLLFQLVESSFTISALISCIQLGLLYFCYYLGNYKLTNFLENLVIFFLVYETINLSNYLASKAYIFLHKIFEPNTDMEFPPMFIYVYNMNKLTQFCWFLYGCYGIMFDPINLEKSLRINPYMTYYLTILILFGFYKFSALIFTMLFFICFCPCIAFWKLSNYYNEIKAERRKQKIQENIKDIEYKEYYKHLSEHNKSNFEPVCSICGNELHDEDMVCGLSCHALHVFHSQCIRDWITKKSVCPLCRYNLENDLDN